MPLIRFFYYISMNQSVTNHTSVRLQKFKVHGVTLFYIFVYKWNTIILRVSSQQQIFTPLSNPSFLHLFLTCSVDAAILEHCVFTLAKKKNSSLLCPYLQSSLRGRSLSKLSLLIARSQILIQETVILRYNYILSTCTHIFFICKRTA